MWELLKKITTVYYDEKDTIYYDNSFPEAIYMIELGKVQLFNESGYSFYTFRKGDHFGIAEIYCGNKNNGTAVTQDHCHMQ